MKYDVFISYSRKDSVFALRVCDVFRTYQSYYSFKFFLDTEEIKSRQEYLVRISDAICESRAMVFLGSKNSYNSEFCSKELLFADKYNVKTHLYRLDNAPMPRSIDLLLIDQHFLEMSSCPIEEMARQVLADVLEIEIKPLSELSVEEVPKEDKQPSQKKVAESVATKESTPKEDSINMIDILALANPIVGIARVGAEIYKTVKKRVSSQATNTTPKAKIYKVGDYYDDGEKQGIVFDIWDRGHHGKIVSLDQAELPWCTKEQLLQQIVIGADSRSDGKANTDKVMTRSDADQYPAFIWCRNKGKDWYLPAYDELRVLLLDNLVRDAVSHTLGQQGDSTLSVGLYWSSTEFNKFSAWRLYMGVGVSHDLSKFSVSHVRAVATF